MNNLTGKVVIVTGAARGIGNAIATHFAKNSAKVVTVDIMEKDNINTQEVLRRQGFNVTACTADVAEPTEVDRIVKTTIDQFGRIDILINNAGIVLRAPVTDIEPDQWDKVMNVNVRSVYLLSRAVIPHMASLGGGAIVNIASGWGIVAGANAAVYCASKGAVVLLTKAMALDHGKQGIRVNCVCPGDTDTQMLREEANQLSINEVDMIKAGSDRPLGRVGSASEIASTVGFLASNDSSYVTGTSLIVDGGSLAGSA